MVAGGTVLSIDKMASAGTPQIVAKDQAGPSAVAVDFDSVYWSNAAGGSVARLGKAGGAVQTIAMNQTAPSHLVADKAGLSWVNGNGDVMGLLRR